MPFFTYILKQRSFIYVESEVVRSGRIQFAFLGQEDPLIFQLKGPMMNQ